MPSIMMRLCRRCSGPGSSRISGRYRGCMGLGRERPDYSFSNFFMQKRFGLTLLLAGVGVVMPFLSWAQDAPVTGLSSTIGGLQATLETVYNTMMQNCGELISVGESLAGFGALLYISYDVWGQLAR